MKQRKSDEEYSKEDLLKFMQLSAKEKLEHLEQLNKFLNQTMPEANKKIWQKLKTMGF